MEAIFLDRAVYFGFSVGVDKHVQTVGTFPQDIIGRAANDHAGFFFGKVPYEIALYDLHLVRRGQGIG